MLSARVYSVQSYMELKQCHGIKGVLCGVHKGNSRSMQIYHDVIRYLMR